MGDAIGQVLSLAVGVAISPVPIIAVVLMLGTARGRVNGPAFIAGWLAGLAAVGIVVLVVAGGAGADDDGGQPTWVGVLKLILGVALVLLAARQFKQRPRGTEDAGLPQWMQAIDTFTPARAVAMGVALSAINPKNLLLTIAAAAAVAQAGLSTGSEILALGVFVVIGTLGPGIPVAIYFAMGDRAGAVLDDVKGWMGAHNAAIMSALLLVIGAKLIGDGISGL
jgi:threonine/homoserine/homoserine lactone efflux protein